MLLFPLYFPFSIVGKLVGTESYRQFYIQMYATNSVPFHLFYAIVSVGSQA